VQGENTKTGPEGDWGGAEGPAGTAGRRAGGCSFFVFGAFWASGEEIEGALGARRSERDQGGLVPGTDTTT